MKRFLPLILALSLDAALPDWYYKIKDVKTQKKAFVEIMLPLINSENQKILEERSRVKEIFSSPNFMLDRKKVAFLSKLAKKYKIKDIFNKEEFLKKIDTIPVSLVLAQATVESGWGKSRFTKEANNIFGQWEYSNRGLIPKSRYDHIDINYSLKIFPSIQDSLKAYMLNLNRNPAYKEFREIRYKYKQQNKKFSGLIAASTMKLYSQLREEYVKILQNMIKSNGWDKYDN